MSGFGFQLNFLYKNFILLIPCIFFQLIYPPTKALVKYNIVFYTCICWWIYWFPVSDSCNCNLKTTFMMTSCRHYIPFLPVHQCLFSICGTTLHTSIITWPRTAGSQGVCSKHYVVLKNIFSQQLQIEGHIICERKLKLWIWYACTYSFWVQNENLTNVFD